MTHHEIQQAVAGLIRAEPWFKRHGYEPVLEASGNLDADLDAAIEEGTGRAILVSVGAFEPQSTDAKYAVGTLEVRCAVAESPPLNRTQAKWAAASQAAEYLAFHLNDSPVDGDTLNSPAYRPEHTPELQKYIVTLKIKHVLEPIPTASIASP